jgi:hypothetical protein
LNTELVRYSNGPEFERHQFSKVTFILRKMKTGYQVKSEQLCRVDHLIAGYKPGWQACPYGHELCHNGLVQVTLASFLQTGDVTLEQTPSSGNGCAGTTSVVIHACLALKINIEAYGDFNGNHTSKTNIR